MFLTERKYCLPLILIQIVYFTEYVQEEIKATKPEMVPEKAPLPSSDEKGQGDCKAMEKEILAPQPVSARSMPSFENVNNFPQQETALKECLGEFAFSSIML